MKTDKQTFTLYFSNMNYLIGLGFSSAILVLIEDDDDVGVVTPPVATELCDVQGSGGDVENEVAHRSCEPSKPNTVDESSWLWRIKGIATIINVRRKNRKATFSTFLCVSHPMQVVTFMAEIQG